MRVAREERADKRETMTTISEYSREELMGICAWELSHRSHGHFLGYLLKAYMNADAINEVLLRPIMQIMVKKYELRDETPSDRT
jgi:hypothetical protein